MVSRVRFPLVPFNKLNLGLGEWVNKDFGLFLLLVGIVGLILPIVHGWILIFVGASLLNYKKLNDFLKKLKNVILKTILGK